MSTLFWGSTTLTEPLIPGPGLSAGPLRPGDAGRDHAAVPTDAPTIMDSSLLWGLAITLGTFLKSEKALSMFTTSKDVMRR